MDMLECGLSAVMKEDRSRIEVGQPELVLKYRAGIARFGLLAMLALFPFWLGWIPYFAWVAGYAVWVAGLHGYEELLLFAMGLGGIFVLCLLNIRVCLDNGLKLSPSGLRVPAMFWLNPLLIGLQRWDRVTALEFLRLRKPSTYPDELRISFGALAGVTLRLDGFSRDDLSRFLLGIEAYKPELPIMPPLAEVDLGDIGGKLTVGNRSFTQMWEADLLSRFGAATFVPLEAGAVLQSGRVTVVGQVAFGGLSAVYLSRLSNGSLAILKEFVLPANADAICRDKALELFDREAKILGSLQHERIAKLLDHFVEGDKHYILLQHITGRDLREFVRDEGAQAWPTVLRWATEVCDILVYLHGLDQPLVHRDLTPDNLVLEPDGSVTLIDFGAANNFLGTATGTLVGKQAYIAPEQFRGKAAVQSDIYSLGCTICFLLTGQDPEPLSVSHPRERAPSVPAAVDDLVAACTALDLPERIASAAALRERLTLLARQG